MILDEHGICLFLDQPETGAQAYILTETVPFRSRSAAGLTLAAASLKLGVDPPLIVWFDEAPEGDLEQMQRDELPVFRHASIQGIASAQLRLIGVNARQSIRDLCETVAHETYHVAGPGDEPAAVSFGRYMQEAMMPLIGFLTKPYHGLAA